MSMNTGSSPLNYPVGAAASAVELNECLRKVSPVAFLLFGEAQSGFADQKQRAEVVVEASKRFLGAYSKQYYATAARERQLAQYCWERACEVIVDANTEQDGGVS